MENMSMYLTWDVDCIFVFQSFHTKTTKDFVIGCVISFLFCFLTVAFSNVKQLALPYFKVNVVSMKICKIFTKMVEIIIRIMVMFLMMTMNGYVNICIVVAMMLGYLVFRSKSNPVCNGYKRI